MSTKTKMLCPVCKERYATKKMTITTENGWGLALLLCDECANDVDEEGEDA
ncbi:MAG: hypothetical protein QM401_04140 [Bacillota bacterium]|nr:hypothetical protein [Bacillota bacterium]